MINRRWFFPALSAAGLAARKPRSVYADLGIRPVLNFQGPVTTVGASKMWPEIQGIMAEAARDFAVLEEVKDAVGARLAKLCGTEDALVTSGTAGAIALGTYACLTGDDNAKVRRLPDLAGMKSEVIIQKPHRNGYDHAVRSAGVKIVEVDSRDQLVNAINPQTAMLYYLGGTRGDWAWETPVPLAECLAITKKAGVPVLIDAANLLPSWDNIPRVAATGVDMIAFSGGKHIRGPQSTGVLAGRKDLMRAAWLNSSPHSDSQGRGMKVNKEEMIGLLAAIEKYSKLDFAALDKEYERQAAYAMSEFHKSGLTVEKARFERGRRVHRVIATWDEGSRGLTTAAVQKKLRDGEPRVAALAGPGGKGIEFTFLMNDPGEEKIVARRMREIFA
ncbi:MAG: aminotransferase class V-fold PLP-dependent enzyme [Acidobacteria bacterium]|nr:aminotransferase class V-fold PLP-dependent enzyme [Acidobacteriota bacterium]